MPRFGPLPALDAGQRMVLASNGVFLEMKTPWLDCAARVGSLSPRLPLPYGAMQERLAFAFGAMPIRLLDEFVAAARSALPDEVAGALIHDEATNGLALRLHGAASAGPEHVDYQIADLAEGQTLAVDLHSHGRGPAFWSATDDEDDRGVRVCGVFGDVDRPRPSARFRLVLNGHFVALPSPWDEPPSPAAGG